MSSHTATSKGGWIENEKRVWKKKNLEKVEKKKSYINKPFATRKITNSGH